jgi:cardiolipin synthase
MYYHWFALVPNLITIGRLILTPITIELIVSGNWRWAFWVFVAAGVSDAIDGWLARSFDLRSELGAVLDPLADKALIMSMFVTLAAVGRLPAWLAIMVVSRDLMILGAVVISWLLRRPVEVNPLMVSKATTFLQLTLAALILGGEAFGVEMAGLAGVLVLLVTALTIASASVYLWRWVKYMGP